MLDDSWLTSQRRAGKRSPCARSPRSPTVPGGAHASLQPSAALPRPDTGAGLLHAADAARQPGDLPTAINPSQITCLLLLPHFAIPQTRPTLWGPRCALALGFLRNWAQGCFTGSRSPSPCWEQPQQWFLMDAPDCLPVQWRGPCARFQLLSLPCDC